MQIPAVTDTGTISVAINGGATASYTWKPTDTWSAVQSGLIAAINTQYGGSLTASASSYGVQLTSRQPGYATNWPVAVLYTSSNPLGTSPAESSYSPTATNMAGGVTAGPGASAGSSYTTVVYTPGGSKLATYTNGVAASTLQAAEIPLPGGGTAMYNASGLNYLRHSDWLGSSRLATTWGHTVYAKTAYAPFGETYNTSGTDASFTGEDVDPNSGYFNFLYRKFDPVAGRWTSPDPSRLGYADITNPQSFNLYAYVMNNPLASFDPDGLECVWDDGSYDSADDPNTGNSDACTGQGGTWILPYLFESALLTNGKFANIEYGSSSDQPDAVIASSWVSGSPDYGDVSGAPNIGSDAYNWWSDMTLGPIPNTISTFLYNFQMNPQGYPTVRAPQPAPKPRLLTRPEIAQACAAGTYLRGGMNVPVGSAATGDPSVDTSGQYIQTLGEPRFPTQSLKNTETYDSLTDNGPGDWTGGLIGMGGDFATCIAMASAANR